jgi:alpha-amylase
MKKYYAILFLLVSWLAGRPAFAQTTSKKVVLQAFWWDYYNDAYRFKWADYLTELAPRLKSLGIDAVWIPPTPKNKNATNDVGYSPFDHYDLGDKYQKGGTGTRFGTKDEFLRMVAVLHANGIEVIQDVVLNHVDGAGTSNGDGGQDPDSYSMQSNSGYKTFRYSSFSTPLPQTTAETATEYLSRNGRWSKNYTNFHPHLGHNTTSGDLAAPYFGPDFCFGDDGGSDGYGGLSGAITSQFQNAYNPTQNSGYSRDEARKWIVWLKKQTGVDGFRWDAVKHFSYPVQQDLSYTLKYNAGWASGGETMFNVGEYVGGKGDLDNYVNTVKAQNGGSDFLMGTFDFGLRDGFYSMVYGNGGFDMGNLPSRQQDQRVQYYSGSNTYVHRTVPFVNNHDTFRPQTSSTGNYTGWNTGSELAPHIDPFEPRLSVAYAVALAMDGSPQIFFEDLFNLGNTGKRYNHDPSSTTDLPVRSDLENLIWCHQNLHFKDGAYRVRYQAQDHLVIERSAKAIIGTNDSYDTWQNNDVQTDFAVGTRLHDYSGANGNDVKTVYRGNDGNKYVNINTPPCNGTAAQGRRGYSVWAPENQGTTYVPARTPLTTQEWEMADDLGDLNCNSLGQGGALPANSTNNRLVSKIYVQAGQPVYFDLYPADDDNTYSLTVGLYDLRGNLLSSASGDVVASGSYTPAFTGWYALKVRNTVATNPGQNCYVKVSYTAPPTVNTRTASQPRNEVAIWTSNNNTTDPGDCRNWENGVEPSATTDVLVPAGSRYAPQLSTGTLAARSLTVESGATLSLAAGTTLRVSGNVTVAGTLTGTGNLVLNGNVPQTLSTGGTTPLALNNLTVSNTSNVRLLSPVTISDNLNFTAGHLVVDNQLLTLGTATVTGTDASRYIITPDVASTGGAVVRTVASGGAAVTFPVGNAAAYAPVTLTNTGTTTTFRVRTFSGVLTNGTGGGVYARQAEFVNRTWIATPAITNGPVVTMSVQFDATEQNARFDRSKASFYRRVGGATGTWVEQGNATLSGTGPYIASRSSVNTFSVFSLGNTTTPLPVTLTRFEAVRVNAGTARITWATALEKDNAGFDIEKSADGQAFSLLASVAAHGGTEPATYRYDDPNVAAAAYYRLRQRDLDGSSHFSPVAYVGPSGSPYYVVPNPSHGETLQLLGGPASAENLPLRLTLSTALGRVVLAPAPASRALLAGQLSEFLRATAPGLYLLTLTSPDGQSQHLRVVHE